MALGDSPHQQPGITINLPARRTAQRRDDGADVKPTNPARGHDGREQSASHGEDIDMTDAAGCSADGDCDGSRVAGDDVTSLALSMPSRPGVARTDREAEIVRLMLQYLRTRGLTSAFESLQQESGVQLEPPPVSQLRAAVLEGRWDMAAHIAGCVLTEPRALTTVRTRLLEQRYRELLLVGDYVSAVTLMRERLMPLTDNEEQSSHLTALRRWHGHTLNSLLMGAMANPGLGATSLQSNEDVLRDLMRWFPPSLTVADGRIEHLMQQASQWQRETCLYHVEAGASGTHGTDTLLRDHVCHRESFPRRNVAVLRFHGDEVWHVQFSHDGRRLASASKDTTVALWDTQALNSEPMVLRDHERAVMDIAWSPDDTRLLTCGQDSFVCIWCTETGTRLALCIEDAMVNSCAWFPDGKHFITAGVDKAVKVWKIRQTQPASLTQENSRGQQPRCKKSKTNLRVQAVTPMRDGRRCVLACHDEPKLRIWDFENDYEICLQELEPITSLALSSDGRMALATTQKSSRNTRPEVHLWDLESGVTVGSFSGHTHSQFVLRACFGGNNDAFISSGSEDGKVYIWRRVSGELIDTLDGHDGPVNSVSWSKGTVSLIASAGDDGTVRIWGPDK